MPLSRNYPDENALYETIRRKLRSDNRRKPIPFIYMSDWTGGPFREKEDGYRAICMHMSPRYKRHVILYDDDALLANETTQQLKDFVATNKPDLSEDDRANIIRRLRENLFHTVKDKPLETRESTWIKWLVETCQLSENDSQKIKKKLEAWKQQNKNYPQYMADTFGVDASKIEMRPIRSVFSVEGKGRVLSQEEQNLLKSQERHYDRCLLQRNPAGASDVARMVGMYDEGGMRLDADILPAINPDLLREVMAVIDRSNDKNKTELLIQKYLFTYRQDLLNPKGYANAVMEGDAQINEMRQIEKVFSKVETLQEVFKNIEAIPIFPALFGLNVKWKKHPSLNNNMVFAHPLSEAVLAARIHQTKVMDYCEDFNEFCMKKEAEKKEAEQKEMSYSEYRVFRHALAKEYFVNNPWPLPGGFSAEEDLEYFCNVMTDDPFDGLIKDSFATVSTSGPNIFIWVCKAIFSSKDKDQIDFEKIAINNHEFFCNRSIEDYDSGWWIDEENQATYSELALETLHSRLTRIKVLIEQLEHAQGEEENIRTELNKAIASLAVIARRPKGTAAQLDGILDIVLDDKFIELSNKTICQGVVVAVGCSPNVTPEQLKRIAARANTDQSLLDFIQDGFGEMPILNQISETLDNTQSFEAKLRTHVNVLFETLTQSVELQEVSESTWTRLEELEDDLGLSIGRSEKDLMPERLYKLHQSMFYRYKNSEMPISDFIAVEERIFKLAQEMPSIDQVEFLNRWIAHLEDNHADLLKDLLGKQKLWHAIVEERLQIEKPASEFRSEINQNLDLHKSSRIKQRKSERDELAEHIELLNEYHDNSATILNGALSKLKDNNDVRERPQLEGLVLTLQHNYFAVITAMKNAHSQVVKTIDKQREELSTINGLTTDEVKKENESLKQLGEHASRTYAIAKTLSKQTTERLFTAVNDIYSSIDVRMRPSVLEGMADSEKERWKNAMRKYKDFDNETYRSTRQYLSTLGKKDLESDHQDYLTFIYEKLKIYVQDLVKLKQEILAVKLHRDISIIKNNTSSEKTINFQTEVNNLRTICSSLHEMSEANLPSQELILVNPAYTKLIEVQKKEFLKFKNDLLEHANLLKLKLEKKQEELSPKVSQNKPNRMQRAIGAVTASADKEFANNRRALQELNTIIAELSSSITLPSSKLEAQKLWNEKKILNSLPDRSEEELLKIDKDVLTNQTPNAKKITLEKWDGTSSINTKAKLIITDNAVYLPKQGQVGVFQAITLSQLKSEGVDVEELRRPGAHLEIGGAKGKRRGI